MRTSLSLRLAAAALAVALSTGSAAAHHVWIEQDGGKASFFFGEFADNLRETSPGRLDRIPAFEPKLVTAAGAAKALKATKGETAFTLDGTAGKGESIVAAVTDYPAFERKKDDKTIRTVWIPAARFVTDLEMRQASLTLDVVPIGMNRDGEAEFQVTYKGAPLNKAEVEIVAQSGWVQTRKTEDDGIFSIALPWQGRYVIEAKHTDNAAGKRGDEAYDAAMFVTSLSFALSEGLQSPPPPPPPAAKPN
jgi:uncharacterized GH25 family protein